MPEAEPTVGAELDAAAKRLAALGVEHARREAVDLWAAAAGTSRAEAWLSRGTTVAPPTRRRFRRAVERRAAGEPSAYAGGTAGFRHLELQVDRRVLIPRPETEGLVDHVLAWADRRDPLGAVVDIGTGSGCIALSLAMEGRFSRVVATDVSAEALAVARVNAARTATRTPVEFRLGSLLDPIAGESFSALVSNPPYVAAGELRALDGSVRAWEPHVALVAGEDGMQHTDALLRRGAEVIEPGGLIAMEIDSRRAETVETLARATGWSHVRIERDLFGRPRFVLATRE